MNRSVIIKIISIVILSILIFTICHLILWIPNKFILGVVGLIGFLSIAWILYLFTTLKSGLVLILLIGAFLVSMFFTFVLFMFSGTFLKEYTFKNKTFYVYDIGFLDDITEVRIKVNYLPITTTVMSDGFYWDEKFSLEENASIVSIKLKDETIAIYDLKNDKKLFIGP